MLRTLSLSLSLWLDKLPLKRVFCIYIAYFSAARVSFKMFCAHPHVVARLDKATPAPAALRLSAHSLTPVALVSPSSVHCLLWFCFPFGFDFDFFVCLLGSVLDAAPQQI